MTNTERAAEIAKYPVAYLDDVYRMGSDRLAAVRAELAGLTGSLLDVGTGRGETLEIARKFGLSPVTGTEVVPALLRAGVVYAEAHALPFPDGHFDTVTCFDVLEHLVAADTEAALAELRRVARRLVIVSAADFSHVVDGVQLHPNRRPYDEWDALIRRHIGGAVTRLGRFGCAEGWRIDVSA